MTIKEFEMQCALGSLTDSDKVKLAENESTLIEILSILSKDDDWVIRYWVAKNENTPEDILKVLSKDGRRSVRYYAIENPNTPKGILKILKVLRIYKLLSKIHTTILNNMRKSPHK